MKVFDEKGKLFGKVNIIDLIVVVALVAVVAAVGWHFLGDDVGEAMAESSAPVLTYDVVCYEVDPNVAQYATTQLDTQLMSQGDLQNGYIRGCEVGPAMVMGADGQWVEDESMRTVTFTVEANTPLVANAYAIGTQEIRTGKKHTVKTVNLEIEGVITAMTVEDAHE